MSAIPEIDAKACVHGVHVSASCAACVSACPVSALVLDNEQLGLIAERCHGCGACQAACPQSAVSVIPDLEPEHGTLLVACTKAEVTADAATLACVHALGLAQLAALYRQGTRRIGVLTGACSGCERKGGASLKRYVDRFNSLAQSRHREPIVLYEASREEVVRWQDNRRESGVADRGRRDFLRRLLVFESKEARGEDADARDAGKSLSEFLGTGVSAKAIYPHVPQINDRRCSGCDACVLVCPHKALMRVQNQSSRWIYQIKPEMCTGCGLCEDICDSQAITLAPMTTHAAESVSLVQFRCRACGVDAHTPVANTRADGLCHICAQTNPYAKLYQVIT